VVKQRFTVDYVFAAFFRSALRFFIISEKRLRAAGLMPFAVTFLEAAFFAAVGFGLSCLAVALDWAPRLLLLRPSRPLSRSDLPSCRSDYTVTLRSRHSICHSSLHYWCCEESSTSLTFLANAFNENGFCINVALDARTLRLTIPSSV
jgi:hypothetical protein